MNNTPFEAQEEPQTGQNNQSPPTMLEEQGNGVNLNTSARSDTVSSDELRVRIQCQNRHFTDPVGARRGSAVSQTRTDRLLASTKVEEMFKFFTGEVRTHINGKCPNCATLHKDENMVLNVHETTPIRCRNNDCRSVFVSLGGSSSPPPLLRQCTLQDASAGPHSPSQGQEDTVEFEFVRLGPSPSIFWDEGSQQGPPQAVTSDPPNEGNQGLDTNASAPTRSVVETEDTTGPPIERAIPPQGVAQQPISRRNRFKNLLRLPRIPKLPFKFRSPVVRRTTEPERSVNPPERERTHRNEETLPETAIFHRPNYAQLSGGQPVEPDISGASTAVDDITNDQESTDRTRPSRPSEGRRTRRFWRFRGCRCSSCACTCACHRGSHPHRSDPTSVAAEPTSSEPQSSGERKSARPNGNAAGSGNGAEASHPFFPQQDLDWWGIRSTEGRSEAGELSSC